MSESSRGTQAGQPERSLTQQDASVASGVAAASGERTRSERAGSPLAAVARQSSMGNTGLKVVFGSRSGGGIDAVETYLHGHHRQSFTGGIWAWLKATQAVLKEQLQTDPETPYPSFAGKGWTHRLRPYGIGSKQLNVGVRVDFPITLEGQGYLLHLADPESPGDCLAKFEMTGENCLFYGDPVAQLNVVRACLDEWGADVSHDRLFRIDDALDQAEDVPGLLYDLQLAGHRLGRAKYGDPRRSASPRGVLEGLTNYFGDKSGPKKALARSYRKWPQLYAHYGKQGERDAIAWAIAERMGFPPDQPLPSTASRLEIQYGGAWVRNNWGKKAGTLEGAISRMHEITRHFLENQVWFVDRPVTEAARESGNLSKYAYHPVWRELIDAFDRIDRRRGHQRETAERVKRVKGLPGGHAKALQDFFMAAERLVALTPRDTDYASKDDARAQAMAYLEFWRPCFDRIERRRAAYGNAEQREAAGLPPCQAARNEFGELEGGDILGPRSWDTDRILKAVEHLQTLQLELPIDGGCDVPF